MHNSGLQSHGYTYINLDDFYYSNPGTTVDQYGRWVADTGKFPSGMASLASYIHGLGLKFGIYVTPGIPVAAYNQNTPIQNTSYHARDVVTDTSKFEANYAFGSSMYYLDYTKPGAQAFVNSFANLFASWGVDYVKIDGVGPSDTADVEAWSQALAQTGRPIHFELSNMLSEADGSIWRQYSNGWRIENDVECYCSSNSYPLTNFGNINFRLSDEPNWTRFAGPGSWNDLDSLELGNGSNDGLTVDQRRFAMTLWSITCAPLLLGADLTNLDSADLAMLADDPVIKINQTGSPGAPLTYNTPTQVWRAAEPDGSYAVAFFNKNASAATVSVTWPQLGFVGPADVQDLYTYADYGMQANGYSAAVPATGATYYRVIPATQAIRYLATASGNTLAGGAVAVQAQWSSNGLDVRNVGMGGTLAFNTVSASASGTYDLTFFYENGDQNTRTAYISVNGGAATPCAFNGNGNWQVCQSLTISAALNAGNNTIAISNPNGWAPNFDSLVVQGMVGGVLANGAYTLTPQCSTGSRMDAAGWSTAYGASVDIWGANGGANQKWIFTDQGGGWYKVQPSYDIALCLDVVGGGTSNGAKIDLWGDYGGSNQRWMPVLVSGNTYRLIPQNAQGLVLEDPGFSTANGTPLDLWQWNGGSNQLWTIGSN